MPVDLSASIYADYTRARKRADEAQKRGDLVEAANAYRRCGSLMRQYAQYASDGEVSAERIRRAVSCESTAARLEKQAAGGGRVRVAPQPSEDALKAGQAREAGGGDDFESAIMALITKTSVHWNDIGGLEDTKRAIKMAYGLALARKPVGVETDFSNNFLFSGPPGGGKTMLAAATAGSLDATFFNVKIGNIISKYVGESNKLIETLYSVARRMNPAVIFLDEFESLTPSRDSGESGAERKVIGTLLAELDGLATKNDPRLIITIAATNLPWMMDSAILSRFQQRIYIPLPDTAARKVILEIHLLRRGHKILVPMDELVQRSAGFSGRELEQLCQFAVSNMMARMNPDLLPRVDKGQDAVINYQLKVEPLTRADFDFAFSIVNPIATPDMIHKYEEWFKKAGV